MLFEKSKEAHGGDFEEMRKEAANTKLSLRTWNQLRPSQKACALSPWMFTWYL